MPAWGNKGHYSIIGPLADDKRNSLGTWSARGNAKNVVSVLEEKKRGSSVSGLEGRFEVLL